MLKFISSILFIISCSTLSLAHANPLDSENSINYALLTQEMTNQLDQISTSAAAAIALSEFCTPEQTGVVGAQTGKRVISMINADPETKKAALLYVKDSADRKVNAFKLSNSGKSCAQVENLRNLSRLHGFGATK